MSELLLPVSESRNSRLGQGGHEIDSEYAYRYEDGADSIEVVVPLELRFDGPPAIRRVTMNGVEVEAPVEDRADEVIGELFEIMLKVARGKGHEVEWFVSSTFFLETAKLNRQTRLKTDL